MQKFQVVVLFALQVGYFFIFGKRLVKGKLFNRNFEYFFFFIQEFALTAFLLVTLVHQFNKKNFDLSQEFIIEMIQAGSIFLAFFVEIMALFIQIGDMIDKGIGGLCKKCSKKKEKERQVADAGAWQDCDWEDPENGMKSSERQKQ